MSHVHGFTPYARRAPIFQFATEDLGVSSRLWIGHTHRASSLKTSQTMAISEMQPISIRKAALADAKAISELGTHVWTQTFGHTVSPEDLKTYLTTSYSPSAIETDISNPSKDLILATTPSNEIIGFTLMTKGSSEDCLASFTNYVELQRIYVHPDHHGCGVGKMLAKAVEDLARQQGFENLWLGVWEENAKALRLYEKLGFKAIGTKEFLVGGQIDTDLVMVKRL
ncbi:acyl-CoA N-acyltransferase [Aureobasidium pullulans]|uniref:Acyl-CoA N-acyltransferase n=3 Tax=Aureobasidium pullulans TaxID=5580 RepID=A0A4S9C2H8_AURPU|nr:acyl-CoA N-acyltransferase [Aureobasidium pullulans]